MSGMATKDFVIGTRGSTLALRQTALVLEPLRRAHPQIPFRVQTIKTTADRRPDHALGQLPGVGFFVKELEVALLGNEIDAAVHSMKDLPSVATAGLIIAAMTEREDPRDALVCRDGLTLDTLPSGARIGTSSPRRAAYLRAHRHDLVMVPVRGNVETRIRKVEGGEIDAVCLAGAGLRRIGLEARISQWLPADVILPAPGQGALGVQTRASDDLAAHIAAAADHLPTRLVVTAERAVLARLAGGCRLPVAAYAQVNGHRMTLRASVAALDGSRIVAGIREGPDSEAERLGTSLGDELLDLGADLIRAAQEAR